MQMWAIWVWLASLILTVPAALIGNGWPSVIVVGLGLVFLCIGLLERD